MVIIQSFVYQVTSAATGTYSILTVAEALQIASKYNPRMKVSTWKVNASSLHEEEDNHAIQRQTVESRHSLEPEKAHSTREFVIVVRWWPYACAASFGF